MGLTPGAKKLARLGGTCPLGGPGACSPGKV